MSSRKSSYLFLVLVMLAVCTAFGGCATCARHPVACTVATAVVAGSIAASVQHHHDQREQHLRCVEAVYGVGNSSGACK